MRKMLIFIASIIVINITCLANVMVKDEDINILVLNSYHVGDAWESEFLKSFFGKKSEWENSGINANVEYLDIKNKESKMYQEYFSQMLEEKYDKGSIELICAINAEAYKYISKYTMDPNSNFYHIPIVFTSLDRAPNLDDKQSKYITGYYNDDSIADGIEYMINMSRDAERVIVIVENDMDVYNIIQEVRELNISDIEVEIIKCDYIEQINSELKVLGLKEDDIIYLGGTFKNLETLMSVSPQQVVQTINDIVTVPIYIYDYSYMGTNFVGAWIENPVEQGKALNVAVKRMAKSKLPRNIPIIPFCKRTYYVNYPNIYKNNIKIEDIPFNCKFINREFYDLLLPRWMIVTLYLSIVIISVGVVTVIYKVILLYHRAKRNKVEKVLEQQRDELKSDFIVNMSHELRTPINIITSTANLIKMNLKDLEVGIVKGGIDNKIDIINQNAYRLLKISNNIIDITKLDMGLYQINKYDWNIIEVVKEVFDDVKKLAEHKQVEIDFLPQIPELIVAIDRENIQRIILNLLSNAIKFTPSGGNIIVTISAHDNNIVIKVIDNGIGIEKGDICRIFSRFYKSDTALTRVNEGCGMGLCIAQELAKIQQGNIKVYSDIGKGSTFILEIPILRVFKMDVRHGTTIIEKAATVELSDIIR